MQKKLLLIVRQAIFFMLMAIITVWLAPSSDLIAAPAQQGEDIGVISSPSSNATVQGVVSVVGSADHPSFQFYIVEFSPEPSSGDQWQIIGAIREQPVINGQLATWDTTSLADGTYTLRLRVVRLDGNYTEAFAQQIVVANSQPTPTGTSAPVIDATDESDFPVIEVEPTITPTDLPPTPTIVIDQPIVDTPTPRPVATSAPLEDPDEEESLVPTVQGFSVIPLRDACLYGGALMLTIFMLFGFLSALRVLIKEFRNRQR
ncbi:MAG: hypothetical protein KDJ52_03810 [Anaerolineae bacterium]|nr:hypothetical protein [Anaerolineae bacterium]